MKISKRETILIIVIIFAITAAAYYIYYWVPTMDEIEQINMSIEQKQIKILSMENAIGQIDNIKMEIANLEAEIEKQTEDIPKGVSQPIQLVAITNIMNEKCDSLVISFNQSSETFEDYQTNVVNLSFSTSYDNLQTILTEFENLDMTNQIVTIDISYSSDITTFYTAILEGYYLTVGMNVEYFSFYADPDAEPIPKQSWEDSPIEYKNPFRPTLN